MQVMPPDPNQTDFIKRQQALAYQISRGINKSLDVRGYAYSYDLPAAMAKSIGTNYAEGGYKVSFTTADINLSDSSLAEASNYSPIAKLIPTGLDEQTLVVLRIDTPNKLIEDAWSKGIQLPEKKE